MKPKATMGQWKTDQLRRKPSRTKGSHGGRTVFNPPPGGWRGAELMADMGQNGPMSAHRKQSAGG